MHQSPRKQLGSLRRGRYNGLEDLLLDDSEADRRLARGTQPRARKLPLREQARREEREARRPRA